MAYWVKAHVTKLGLNLTARTQMLSSDLHTCHGTPLPTNEQTCSGDKQGGDILSRWSKPLSGNSKENYNLIRGSGGSLIFKAYYKNNSPNFADLKGCCNRYQSVYLAVKEHTNVSSISKEAPNTTVSLILQIAFHCLRCYSRPTVKWQICWQMDPSHSSKRQLWDSWWVKQQFGAKDTC